MNFEELEERDDVKGINRSGKRREERRGGKTEKGPIRPSAGRSAARRWVRRKRAEGSDCFKDGSARVEREREAGTTEREKLPPFPVLTVQCFLTAREREREERAGKEGRKEGKGEIESTD